MIKSFRNNPVPFLCLMAAVAVLYGRNLVPHETAVPPETALAHALPPPEVITLHYHERPPYYVTGPLGVYGLCVNPVKQAFKEAGINIRWETTPAARQLDILKANQSRDGLIGWFKNPEREGFARYSRVIYQDGPNIALALSADERIISGGLLAEALGNDQLVLLRKIGYSYGRFIDTAISRLTPRQVTTDADNLGMLKMILAGRADYFFIAEEEAAHLIASSGLLDTDFKFIRFSDMPGGNCRYLLFSRQVETEIIEKINRSIEKHVHQPACPAEQ